MVLTYDDKVTHDIVYSSLDSSHASTRLLELRPGEHEDDIECTIRVVNLDDHPHYEAVSYVCGKGTHDKTIKLAGHDVLVTRNLYYALRWLRYPDRARILWVDALCINQANAEEKTCQTVGDNGVRCTVEDADALFEVIRCFKAADPDGSLPANLSSPARKGAANAIRGMMFWGNEWWRRIWTVQEAIIPPRRIFIWQKLSISWETCLQAAENMGNPSTHHRRLMDHLAPEFPYSAFREFISPIISLHFTRKEALERPLCTLHRWRHRDATDPRDKVYALMGLFQSAYFPSINCDYTLSTATVFKRLTLDLLRLERTLLPLVGWRGELHVTQGLPTWELDMVRPTKLVNSGCKFWEHMDRFYRFQADQGMSLEMQTMNDDTVISLKGLPIDIVLVVDEGIAVDERVTLPNEDFIHIVKRRGRLFTNFMAEKSSDEYIVGDSRDNAFWRTMLGDLVMNNERVKRRAVASDRELFYAFLENSTWNEVVESLKSMILNQAFFITKQGYIGIGPPNTRNGDTVWVLVGGRMPFVLRPTGSNLGGKDIIREYTFIGDAFVKGVMDGELIKGRQDVLETVLLH